MLNNSRGFTLIEVLIAIVVIAGGLVLIVEGMVRSQEIIGISKNLVTAVRMAEEKMTKLEMEALQGKFMRTSSDNGAERVGGRSFAWEWRVSVYPDSAIIDQSKMNQAGVSVKWKEGVSRQNHLTVDALFLNREKKG